MNAKQHTQSKTPWKRPIVENRLFMNLLMLLLVLLVLFIFTKIAYLFEPVWIFLQFFAFPFVATGIFYYLFSPIVVKLSRRGMNRHFAIWLIYVSVILLAIWGVATLVPIVQSQTRSFMDNLPSYLHSLNSILESNPLLPDLETTYPSLAHQLDQLDINRFIQDVQPLVSTTFGGLTNVLGTVSTVVAGLVTIPVLLYYMLLEGYHLIPTILYFVPNKYRSTVKTIIYQSHYQVGRYIRGQILVAIVVGLMFAFGFSVIGLDYSITLGLLAMVLNVVPYIGSILAAVPALIIGLTVSPFMFIKVVMVLAIENFIEGRLVQPHILGSNLKIHPVTILLVLLGAGRLFGLTGVILGVPAFAVIKVVFTELYQIYRDRSSLYKDDDIKDSQKFDSKRTFEKETGQFKSDSCQESATEDQLDN